MYDEIVSEKRDDFYDNFDEFLTFCNTPLNSTPVMEQFVLLPKIEPKIEHKKYIANKLMTVHFTHDDTGQKNKPITYFKCKYNKTKR